MMILLVLVFIILGVGAFKARDLAISSLSRKAVSAKNYDPEYVRSKEMEIWGYYWTPEPEVDKPNRLPPRPPRGPSVADRRAQALEGLNDRIKSMEAKEKALVEQTRAINAARANQRVRHVEFNGCTYEARIPDVVPDSANLTVDVNFSGRFAKAIWKYTDKNTGRQMMMVSTAIEVDAYEISSMDGFRKTYYRPISDWSK